MEISRESIFISALRSFSKMFFAVCGIFLAFLLVTFLYSFFSQTSLLEEKTTLDLLPDANGVRDATALTAPAILQLNIHGIIGDPSSLNAQMIEDILLDSRSGILRNDRVKGILIHFDTPGGTVVDSDNIYRMLLAYKKKYNIPVFAYVEGLCASGGMYIASSADQIFASPVSAIGSVGVVFGPFFNVFDTLDKIGVKARTLTEGIDKDMMNPTRPWREGEDASIKAIMGYFYDRFVDIVTTARPRLSKEKLVHQYGAQIFDCRRAQEFGFIDTAMASRKEALLALLKQAQIDPEKGYQVVPLEPKQSWISHLLKGEGGLLSGVLEHRLDLGQPKIQNAFAYLF